MYNAKYSPISRNHEVQNEDGQMVESFPAGDAGRQAARERAIQLNDTNVYRLAWYYAHDLFRNHKDLFGRIWSAAELVITGQAQYRYGADDNILIARVKSQTITRWCETCQRDDPVEYGIKRDINGRYHCQCFDYHNAAPKVDGQQLCKHILAAKIIVGIHPQKYTHMHGISQDMSAALESAYHHSPKPQPTTENTELTAALHEMRIRQARYMTDLSQEEIDRLLGREVALPEDFGHCGRGGTITAVSADSIRVAYQSEMHAPGISSYGGVKVETLDELNEWLFG